MNRNGTMPRPRVSVALPVFDGEDYLAEAIGSILGQDLEELELIIGDNGSTDRTEEICREVTADPRVRYERSPVNRGAAWNYNRLVDMANAPLFKWAAHDDVLAPSFLRRCVEHLDGEPAAVIAYPQSVLIDGGGRVIDAGFRDGLDLRLDDPLVRFRRYLVHPGEQHPVFGVIRTDALRRTNLIANCWGGDQVLLAELLMVGEFHEVPERLFMRRYHPGTSLAANRTPADVARWYDPARRVGTTLPRTRLTVELAEVAMTSDLPLATRARCTAAIATDWVPRYGRVIAGEIKRAARARLGSLRCQRHEEVR
jgi:glycosyltransferase involved in cell wall biosynthesis